MPYIAPAEPSGTRCILAEDILIGEREDNALAEQEQVNGNRMNEIVDERGSIS